MIAAGLFVIAATIIAVAIALASALPAFSADTNANNLVTKSQTMFLNLGNTGFIFIAVALIIFNIFASFFLPTHPIFVVIDVIFLPISMWIAAILSNSWATTLSTLASTYGYTIMDWIMSNLVMIILATDVITAIVSYAIVKNTYA